MGLSRGLWVSLCVLCVAAAEGRAAAGPGDILPDLRFELWGRTSYGDGYVYGPPYRSSGVTVVDYDVDDDYDFVLPSVIGKPQVMRNLGNNRAFFPGGPRTLDIPDPASGAFLSRYMDFADLTGDGLPDLVVVANHYNSDQARIYWYKNLGPRENPTFQVQGSPVYTENQVGLPLGPVDLVDADNDGLMDLTFIEFTMSPPSAPPKVYIMRNTGTAAAPSWQPRVELRELSRMLPAPRVIEKSEQRKLSVWGERRASKSDLTKGVLYADRVTDMEFGDWDGDGDIDFLFYDSEWGVDYVKNVGSAQNPKWDTVLNPDYIPYRHAADFFSHVQGSFAVRPGPGLSPYPDFYVSVEGMLLTWRYNTRDELYEVVQRSAVAFDAETGPAAFWDYDGDGDLDMFRTEFADSDGWLMVFPNVGTPYSPIWDYPIASDVAYAEMGTAENGFRQDNYVFADGDGDLGKFNGNMELFLQEQAGYIYVYEAWPSEPGGPPVFEEGGYIDFTPTGTGIQPRGIAVADFNGSFDGVCEIFTAYSSDQGAQLVYLTQLVPGDLYGPWSAPYVWNLLDKDGKLLDPDLIEGLASADLDRDGRVDLIVTLSEYLNYDVCTFHVYRNVLDIATNTFHFEYAGELAAPTETDNGWARMLTFADVDTDGDPDLFVAHQYYDPEQPNPQFNRYPYLHFYRNNNDTGLGFWQTRVVSGQKWYFTIGGEYKSFNFISNASGGRFESDGAYVAGPTSKVVDIIESTDASPNYRIFIDVLPEVGPESKAILIAGGKGDDPLYPSFEYIVGQARDALLLQGLQADSIRIYGSRAYDADGDGQSDVFAAPTLANIRTAITQWAAGSDRFLVYMVDHGQRDRFRLNEFEYLTAQEYDLLLDQLQQKTPDCVVTTVIDTCESGSFVDNLRVPAKALKAGVKRITITSADTGPTRGIALFDETRAISFSLSFWEEIRNGSSYGRAFSTAKVAIESINPLQVPQIDDNGNGIGNEGGDGLQADLLRPGADFEQPTPGVYIGEVAPPRALSSNSATLWLSDVVAGFPVEGAGALIVPPSLNLDAASEDDEQPISDLAWVDFTYNANQDRWEGTYNGFTVGGLYRIQYYVSVLGTWHASPRIGFVDRIGTPDAWEPDDTAVDAPWLTANVVQGHNFHKSGDTDWARFVSPASGTATLAVLAPAANCQPVVDLFRVADLETNPSAAYIRRVEAPGPGKDIVFEHTFTRSEAYLLRVTNKNPAVFGAGTSYMLMAAVGTGGLTQPILIVTVREQGTNKALDAASVKALGAGVTVTNKTTGDGQVQFICANGSTYTVSAEKGGYHTGTAVVRMNNNLEARTVYLVPQATPTVTLAFKGEPTGAKLTFNGAQYDLPQTFTVPAHSTHSVSVPAQLAGGFTWNRWSDGNTQTERTLSLGASDVTLVARYTGGQLTDINQMGGTNAVDVQLVVNAVLGYDITPYLGDVNGDGQTNAIDVQRVINGALGIF